MLLRHTQGVKIRLYSFLNVGARWSGWLRSRPSHFSLGITWYMLYRRLDVPQVWSERVRKISPLTGLDSRTIQRLARRHTD